LALLLALTLAWILLNNWLLAVSALKSSLYLLRLINRFFIYTIIIIVVIITVPSTLYQLLACSLLTNDFDIFALNTCSIVPLDQSNLFATYHGS